MTTITKRVAMDEVSSSIYRPWGLTWGGSWGLSWLVLTSLSTIGHTARVSEAITENTTKRVTGL